MGSNAMRGITMRPLLYAEAQMGHLLGYVKAALKAHWEEKGKKTY